MEKKTETARPDLTPEQKAEVKRQTGKDKEAAAIELNVEELEERIAPVCFH